MKQLYSVVLIIIVALSSCGVDAEDNKALELENQRLLEVQAKINADIQKASVEKVAIYSELDRDRATYQRSKDGVIAIEKKLKALESGKRPRYILELKLKQGRMSLDPFKHAKDAMNAITFEIPVDESFYNSVTINQKLVNDFRSGSFILNGTWSKWRMTVKNKRIIYD